MNRKSRCLYLGMLLALVSIYTLLGGQTGCEPDSFTVVLLPDTQYYTEEPDDADNPYYHQAQWIVDQKEAYDIRCAVHLGDMTDNNALGEWQIADTAHAILDSAAIPYSAMPGTHDYPRPDGTVKRDLANYNDHFGPDRFAGEPWYGGHFGDENASNYIYFDDGDLHFMVVSLEFAPTKDVLCWANNLIQDHPDHRVIVVTHCYQENGGDHRTDCGTHYNVIGSGGDVVWQELASRHSNVFLVLSGHITDSEHMVRVGNAGNLVHEVLTDYQNEEPCSSGLCLGACDGPEKIGNGWLRTVEFIPGENRIQFSSHSAEDGNGAFFPGGTPKFFCNDYAGNPGHSDHTFSIDYDMTSTFGPYLYNDGGTSRFNDRTVNSVGSGQQLDPAVAMNADSGFVAAWEDDQNENGFYQVYARGFAGGGCEAFADIVVASDASGQQVNPAVAVDAAGNFVVAWQDDRDENDKYQIRLRGFHADGSERFPDMTVNSAEAGQQLDPSVAMDAGGNFVVVWEDDQDLNGLYQVYMRGFNPDGTERFSDRVVNSNVSGQHLDPSVDMNPGGDFVVAWEDDNDENGKYQIYARGFNTDGTERFADMTVNSVNDGQQLGPAVAMDSGGGFVVAWEDDQNLNGLYQIYARGFNADGTERFADMTVNSIDDGQQLAPTVAMDLDGDFVVAWEDDKDGNGTYQVYARGFDAGGVERFGDRAVNTDSTGQQLAPAIAIDGDGNFIVAWEDDVDDNDFYQIVARGLDASGE